MDGSGHRLLDDRRVQTVDRRPAKQKLGRRARSLDPEAGFATTKLYEKDETATKYGKLLRYTQDEEFQKSKLIATASLLNLLLSNYFLNNFFL